MIITDANRFISIRKFSEEKGHINSFYKEFIAPYEKTGEESFYLCVDCRKNKAFFEAIFPSYLDQRYTGSLHAYYSNSLPLGLSFDPVNLAIGADIDAKSADKYFEITREHRRFNDGLEYALSKLPEKDRRFYILSRIGMIHENQHFHMTVGTQFGFMTSLLFLRDAAEFHNLIEDMRSETRIIKVPLIRWAKSRSGPRFLYDYFLHHLTISIALWLSHGIPHEINLEKHLKNESSIPIVYKMPNDDCFFSPGTGMMFVDDYENPKLIEVIPLNAKGILESIAYLAQQVIYTRVIREKLNSKDREWFDKRLMKIAASPYLSAINYEANHGDIGFGVPILADMSLMGNESLSFPGLKFARYMRRSIEAGKNYKLDLKGREFIDCWNSISVPYGEPSYENSLRTLRANANGLFQKGESLIINIKNRLVESYAKVLALREKQPEILGNILGYLRSIHLLPQCPIILGGRNKSWTAGIDKREEDQVKRYLVFIHVMADLLHKDHICCPIKYYKWRCEKLNNKCGVFKNRLPSGHPECIFADELSKYIYSSFRMVPF